MIINFTGTWHDYYIVTRHLVLLNSCAPELLYSWTPVTERLLTLCFWYYTSVDSHNWIIMDIGLLWTPCGHYHWTISNNWTTYTGTGTCLWWLYICCTTNSWDSTWRPPGASKGCTGTPTPCLLAWCAIIPWVYLCGERWHSILVQEYQMFGNNIIIMSSPRKSDNHEYAM